MIARQKVGFSRQAKNGRMEEWKNGRMEEWKDGRVEEWKNGRVEEWKNGKTLAGCWGIAFREAEKRSGYERIVSSQPGKTIGLLGDRFSRS